MRCRRGLTLIELTVVVAILGLLTALGLSAVNAARESSRRAQCVGNLGQFGRALGAYQSANRAFPPAMPAIANNPNNSSHLWYAPHVSLLPYVEQMALAGSISLQQPLGPALGPPGLPVGQWPGTMFPWTQLTVFRCPSDQNPAGALTGNNYRVCTGPGNAAWESVFSIDGGLGAFVASRPQKPAEFLDGLSATIGAAEKLSGSGGAAFSRTADFWYSGSSLLGNQTPNQMAGFCDSLTGTPAQYYTYSGATWFFAGYENTWYNHVLPPNAEIPDCSRDFMQSGASPTGGGAFRASSRHPGGVNSLYMDGSVRFVANGIDLATWRAASTRSGGEAVALGGN